MEAGLLYRQISERVQQESKWQASFIQHGLSLRNVGQSAAKCTDSERQEEKKEREREKIVSMSLLTSLTQWLGTLIYLFFKTYLFILKLKQKQSSH